jgi:hypothetical protein
MLGRRWVKVQDILEGATVAMEQVLINSGYENPCDYIGSYNKRPISGTDYWSTHSYGIAIDLDYGGDTDGDGDPTIDKNPHVHRRIVPGDPGFGVEWQILEHQIEKIEAIKNADGDSLWRWLGWSIGDTMHFQINVAPQFTQVDWSTVYQGEPEMADIYETFVAGWVKGLAEDPNKTRTEFTRLNTEQQSDGGYVLEPANDPATVEYWMDKLDTPYDPAWPGFYARTELSVWAR